MKRLLYCLLSLSLAMAWSSVNAFSQNRERVENLKKHVYYFASDSLRGRKAGTEDSAIAAAYIQTEYEKAGVVPFFEDGWEMPFSRKMYRSSHFFNIVGIIPGNDPVLKNEYIVVGAHFDHLGVRADGEVFNGADDNASGSAAVIEIAKQICDNRDKLKRSVIIAGFDGEELGLFGSTELAERFKEMGIIDNIKLMISVDMVGWLEKGGALSLEGTGTIKNGEKILGKHASALNLPVKNKKFENSVLTATDTQGFAKLGTATLAITTGTKSPYHKVGDDADLIDYEGLDKICEFISRSVLEIASDRDYAPTGKVASKHKSKMQLIEMAPIFGFGSSDMVFKDGGFTTMAGNAYQAGLGIKLNIKHFGLQVDGLYEQLETCFPVESALFSKTGTYTQKAVTVPAYFMVQTKTRTERAFFGVGPVWKHNIEDSISKEISSIPAAKEDMFGYGLTFGYGLGSFVMSADFKYYNKCFDTAFKNRLNTSYFTISYWF